MTRINQLAYSPKERGKMAKSLNVSNLSIPFFAWKNDLQQRVAEDTTAGWTPGFFSTESPASDGTWSTEQKAVISKEEKKYV